MRCLTLHRPWPYAIFYGSKAVENRTWVPLESLIGQDIAIHAGQVFDRHASAFVCNMLGVQELRDHEAMSGAKADATGIIGVVTIAAVVRTPDRLRAFEIDERWWGGGAKNVGWVLSNRRPLKKPIQVSGKLGLWDLPRGVEARLLAEIGAAV